MDGYSRLVAWLKVLLPLTALALLSTLFLLSRTIDPVASIPFAQTEIEDRLRDHQITEPFFSGTTDGGDRVSLTATTMRRAAGLANEIDDMSAQIDLSGGTRVLLMARSGSFDMQAARSELKGDVQIVTSDGFEMETDALLADLDSAVLESDGTVTANSPLGRLTAGQMRMERTGPEGNSHLIFTNGVKLLYDPVNLEE